MRHSIERGPYAEVHSGHELEQGESGREAKQSSAAYESRPTSSASSALERLQPRWAFGDAARTTLHVNGKYYNRYVAAAVALLVVIWTIGLYGQYSHASTVQTTSPTFESSISEEPFRQTTALSITNAPLSQAPPGPTNSVSVPEEDLNQASSRPIEDSSLSTMPPSQVEESGEHGLYTDSQCSAEFPELYYEIDRAHDYWQSLGMEPNETFTNTPERSWSMTFLIHDNELRILYGNSGDYRGLSFATLMHEAITEARLAGERLPSIQATMRLSDRHGLRHFRNESETHPRMWWGWCRQRKGELDQRLWLVPDFNLYAGTHSTYRQKQFYAHEYDAPFAQKIPKAAWGGDVNIHPIRRRLIKATANQTWADVWDINWRTKEGIVSPSRFCQYAFLIYTEGISASSRITNMLTCDSVPIVHKPAQWLTHIWHLFKDEGPEQNIVAVDRRWKELKPKVVDLLNRPEEGQRIVNNAVATFRDRYTSAAATRCYMRRLITTYSKASFKPRVWREQSEEGKAKGRLRGMPFGAWAMQAQWYSEEHDESADWLTENPVGHETSGDGSLSHETSVHDQVVNEAWADQADGEVTSDDHSVGEDTPDQ